MKKWIAMLMAIMMLLTLVACGGGNSSDTDDGADVEQVTPTPEPEGNDGYGGAHSEQIEEWKSKIVTTINFTLPEAMWCPLNINNVVYLYNVESLDVAHSAAPRIQFETQQNLERINLHVTDFKDLKELDPVVLGGVEMSARSYNFVGMDWTEYYGELPNGAWISIQISKVELGPGTEAETILNTVTFG